jgi:hypothetical protein
VRRASEFGEIMRGGGEHMSGKTKVIGALEGAVIGLGLYSAFMALMVVIIRMMIGSLWFDAPADPPSLTQALPKLVLFLVLTIAAVLALERVRRAPNEAMPG